MPSRMIWDKVFKGGPSKICGRQPLKIWESRPYPFKYFKGSLPQILLGRFLNILSYININFILGLVYCILRLTDNCKKYDPAFVRRA